VVLTHLHTDHAGGLHHFPGGRILVHSGEWQATGGLSGWLNGYMKQNWPSWLNPVPFQFEPERVGPFAESFPVTRDGRIRLVPTLGHTAHHVSVLIQDEDVTYFLAGDTSYNQAMMLAGIPDGVGLAETAATTLGLIRAFAHDYPTVYLPSHDPDSAARLANRQTVPTNST
jgi:N-acyl homoserine lactone hydrolase